MICPYCGFVTEEASAGPCPRCGQPVAISTAEHSAFPSSAAPPGENFGFAYPGQSIAVGAPPTEGRMALAGPVNEEPANPATTVTPPAPQSPPHAARPAPQKPAKSQPSWAMQILARRDSQN